MGGRPGNGGRRRLGQLETGWPSFGIPAAFKRVIGPYRILCRTPWNASTFPQLRPSQPRVFPPVGRKKEIIPNNLADSPLFSPLPLSVQTVTRFTLTGEQSANDRAPFQPGWLKVYVNAARGAVKTVWWCLMERWRKRGINRVWIETRGS